ncbi:hypothetical protein D3C85_1274210 [compost metagenome]
MRPLDLDQISDGAISLSQVIVLDDPAQSFKATLLQLADFLEARVLERQFPVGSTLYRVDNRTPMELGFPGTWTRYAEGLSLATGRADGADTGTTAGSNSVAVPLLQHNHSVSEQTTGLHNHQSEFAAGGEHAHDVDLRIRLDFAPGTEHHVDSTYGARTNYGGAHSHNITVGVAGDHTHSVSVRMLAQRMRL